MPRLLLYVGVLTATTNHIDAVWSKKGTRAASQQHNSFGTHVPTTLKHSDKPFVPGMYMR